MLYRLCYTFTDLQPHLHHEQSRFKHKAGLIHQRAPKEPTVDLILRNRAAVSRCSLTGRLILITEPKNDP